MKRLLTDICLPLLNVTYLMLEIQQPTENEAYARLLGRSVDYRSQRFPDSRLLASHTRNKSFALLTYATQDIFKIKFCLLFFTKEHLKEPLTRLHTPFSVAKSQ